MTITDTTDLPVFPGARSGKCPFNPAAEYTQWREQPGLQQVSWNGHTVWAVSRYEDIKAAMSDPAISAEALALQSNGAHEGPSAPDIFPRMDDPEHARLRRMLTKDFTVKRVNAMRPQIEEMANGFIDKMIAKGQPADLVADYALPIPSLVISLLLGVPYADHDFFQTITGTVMNINSTREEKAQASREFFGYMMELVARKDREPGDDLISRIIREHVQTGELRRESAAMNGVILLNAGHETTANMISLSTAALLQDPDKAAVLRDSDDPAVIANAVEELLRYLTIVHSLVARVAKERRDRRTARQGRRRPGHEPARRQLGPGLHRPAGHARPRPQRTRSRRVRLRRPPVPRPDPGPGGAADRAAHLAAPAAGPAARGAAGGDPVPQRHEHLRRARPARQLVTAATTKGADHDHSTAQELSVRRREAGRRPGLRDPAS